MKCWAFIVLLYSSSVLAMPKPVSHGAQVFTAYCSGCHSLKYMSLQTSLYEEDARLWFGAIPPDLSLIATIRGERWLRDYLNGFYPDIHQCYGENNYLLPNLKMPNPFSMVPIKEKAALVQDLTTFLVYTADPSMKERQFAGIWILLGLSCISLLFYTIKKIA